jgi:Killing trait
MTNPEQVISEQQTANETSMENEISNYAEIFCKTMSELNAVALEQTQGLLNIAVTAAEKFHSLNPAAQANNEELGGFINQLKNTADNLSQTNQPTPENLSAQSAPNAETFIAAVEQALGNAIHNSANNQQQLNIIGAAILTQSAALLLSSGEKQN